MAPAASSQLLSQSSGILEALTQLGDSLLAFSEFPHAPGKSRLNLSTEDAGFLENADRDMGLSLSEKKSGFLIQGEDRPGAMAEVLTRLAEVHIAVTAV